MQYTSTIIQTTIITIFKKSFPRPGTNFGSQKRLIYEPTMENGMKLSHRELVWGKCNFVILQESNFKCSCSKIWEIDMRMMIASYGNMFEQKLWFSSDFGLSIALE